MSKCLKTYAGVIVDKHTNKYSVASENKTLRTRCRILLYYHCMLIYVKYIYYINLILIIFTTSIWVLIPCILTYGFVKCTPDALFYSIIVFIYFI